MPFVELEGSLPCSQEPSTGRRPCITFRNKLFFNGEELLAPRPTPRLEDHTLSAVRDCLFNIFAATLHSLRPFSHSETSSRHAMVTGTHVGMEWVDAHFEQCPEI
jgi:hypothetical protein